YLTRLRRPPLLTPFPYTTLFRSDRHLDVASDQERGHEPLALRSLLVHLALHQLVEHEAVLRVPDQHHATTLVEVLEVVVPSGERSEEHTSELQSRFDLVCRLLLE